MFALLWTQKIKKISNVHAYKPGHAGLLFNVIYRKLYSKENICDEFSRWYQPLFIKYIKFFVLVGTQYSFMYVFHLFSIDLTEVLALPKVSILALFFSGNYIFFCSLLPIKLLFDDQCSILEEKWDYFQLILEQLVN